MSMALWTFGMEPIARTYKTYYAIPNYRGWPLGTECALIPKRLGRQKLRTYGPSTKVGIR